MSKANSLTPPEFRFSKPFHCTYDIEKIEEADNTEKQKVITTLKSKMMEFNDDQELAWSDSYISLDEHSSFELALQPGAVMLQRLIEKEAFRNFLLRSKLTIPADAFVYVSSKGQIGAIIGKTSYTFTLAVKRDPELNEDFSTLIEIASMIGGLVFLGKNIEVKQWLSFHEYEVPKKLTGIKNLINHLEFNYHPGPPIGNYWGMITGRDEGSVVLSPEERARVRTLTLQNIGGQAKLLADVCQIALGSRSNTVQRLNCRELLHEVGTHSSFKHWSEGYIKALGWYGANPGEPLSDLCLEQVLMTAIILDIYPGAGEDEPRNHVAGYNLYAPDNIEKTVPDILTELERHLENEHEIPSFATTLAAYLLLAGKAPEFLVRDLPASLRLGTPEWITFCRGVALAEANALGAALSMTYSKVMQLEAIEPVNHTLETLHSVLAVDPIVDWALLNGIVTLEQVSTHYQGTVEHAIAAYQAFADCYTQTATTLVIPMPTRKEISLEILRHIVPGCDFLEEKILYEKQRASHEFGNFEPLAMSMVELNMSNHLGTRAWDVKNRTSIYQTFPNLLPNLVSTEGVFKRRFDQAYAPLEKAMVTAINLTLSALPPVDRTRLLCGEVTFFTLRPSVGFLQAPVPYRQEKQKDKDEATGRYGVVMCSNYEGNLYCYELSTLHCECRENPELARLIENENLLQQPARVDFTGHPNSLTQASKILTVPTDIESYTHGTSLRNTYSLRGVIDKLGTLPVTGNTARDTQKSYYLSFNSGEFNTLANFILKHRPVWSYDELIETARERTELEHKLLQEEHNLETFINFIVPFKSCIEDVNSDDPDRNRDSVLSCKIEFAMTLLLVVGVTAKAISIAGKSASIASKTRALAKIGIGFLNAAFNPLDGTPELIFGAGKYLKKGVFGIGRVGLESIENATLQFRKLTGSAQSYDVAKAAQRTDFGQGIWRPHGTAAESFLLSAARSNDHWYALNRLGQPWGKKLKNFELTVKSYLPKLDKLMPKNYTRNIVKESLPVARTKIDNAINVLSDTTLNYDTDLAIHMLLGDGSREARHKYLAYLRELKADFSKVTPDNIIFDGAKADSPGTLASLNPDWYQEWKAASTSVAARKQFMRVNVRNFNDHYRQEFFNPGATADDLVHELFHGAPDTYDFAYAIDPKKYEKGRQQLDVAGLLNLASGHAHVKPGIYPPEYFTATKAFENADSFSVTTSLLSQLKTDKQAFLNNLNSMKTALDRSRNGYIGWPVLVNLNTV